MKIEERRIVTDSDFFSRMDVSLRKKNGDMGHFVVDGVSIRMARVIHTGETKGDGQFEIGIIVSHKEILKEFVLQRQSVWTEVLESCVSIKLFKLE